MPRRAATKGPAPPRKRRTADEARTAILDASERMLVAAGPAGIRLQQIAADVGVSHSAVLHHFGSREKLVEAVVARATHSLQARLVEAVRASAPKDTSEVRALLDGVFEALAEGNQGRAYLWLALDGYAPPIDAVGVRAVAEAVHEVRRERRRAKGKRAPAFDDTYFTILLPALAMLSLSVLAPATEGASAEGATRFRAWLARLIHAHLEEG